MSVPIEQFPEIPALTNLKGAVLCTPLIGRKKRWLISGSDI
ncbi:hypothetical protein CES85_2612 [Ochrobactrum quorumnocens]|uniref:Uncharacterized protein n=1 Tax=Ochrobactrum quorumnocens TaxID=271865 RepID=A0A248UJY3_9HYPH|nr:hypothetical protein CES85_2612 [[Ochrobactrum] quorumnocens]